jgi:hypothetical protein
MFSTLNLSKLQTKLTMEDDLESMEHDLEIMEDDLESMEDNLEIMEDNLESMDDDLKIMEDDLESMKCLEGQIKNLLGPALYTSCTLGVRRGKFWHVLAVWVEENQWSVQGAGCKVLLRFLDFCLGTLGLHLAIYLC